MLFSILRNKAVLVATVLLAADILTKFLTHLYLPLRNWTTLWYPYGGIGVFQDVAGVEFSIIHATNKGAAWGILSDFQDYLLIFRILLICSLVAYMLFFNKNKQWQIPLAMIIGGALGNVLDFFIYGHVVDMLHFVLWGYDFPVFNVADSAIFLGICTLFVMSWLENPGTSNSKSSFKSKG